jgi:hypothetical protein
MVRHFINPSTIQIKKTPTATAHGSKEQIPPWAAVLPQRHVDARR